MLDLNRSMLYLNRSMLYLQRYPIGTFTSSKMWGERLFSLAWQGFDSDCFSAAEMRKLHLCKVAFFHIWLNKALSSKNCVSLVITFNYRPFKIYIIIPLLPPFFYLFSINSIYLSIYLACLGVCLFVCVQYTSKGLIRSGPHFVWDFICPQGRLRDDQSFKNLPPTIFDLH